MPTVFKKYIATIIYLIVMGLMFFVFNDYLTWGVFIAISIVYLIFDFFVKYQLGKDQKTDEFV